MLPPSSNAPAESWLELPDGRLFWLKLRCTVGRYLDNDLVLESVTLSRHHALIASGASGYSLTDLHSSNGSYVNNTRISRPVPLQDRDEIRFGDVQLRFRCTRRLPVLEAPEGLAATQQMEDMRMRSCWLLLADVEGFTALNQKIGSEAALRRLQTWIAEIRPLVERNGGQINGYLGDAIFAYWLAETAQPAEVIAAGRAIEGFRPRSPLVFRLVVHYGNVLFIRTGRGDELSGQEVSFLFSVKKIAKSFGTRAMLSQAAVKALGIENRCETYGRSAIDGMSDFFLFYSLPRDLIAPPAAQ
jgi:class 3 adenylate cyclase